MIQSYIMNDGKQDVLTVVSIGIIMLSLKDIKKTLIGKRDTGWSCCRNCGLRCGQCLGVPFHR